MTNSDDEGFGRMNQTLVRRALPWLLLVSGIGIGLLFPFFIFGGINPAFFEIYERNFIVIIGLPLAAFGALVVVVFLEQAQGPLEFEGLGFKFRGASGPVVLWVLCYLALVVSFKVLWVPEP